MYKRLLHLYRYLPVHQRIFLWLRLQIAPFSQVIDLLPTHGSILEVGCGHGLLSNLIALHSEEYHVTGIDVDAKRITIGSSTINKRTNIHFLTQDIRVSLNQQNRFDVIVFFDVLHHIAPSHQLSVINEALKLLNPKGMIILKEINTKPIWKYVWNLLHDYVMTKEYIYCRSAYNWQKILKNHHLKTTIGYSRVGRCYPHIFITGQLKR